MKSREWQTSPLLNAAATRDVTSLVESALVLRQLDKLRMKWTIPHEFDEKLCLNSSH